MDHDSAADGKRSDSAGAPGHEIEVTPAMIAAGIDKLWGYDPAFSNECDIVAEIFMAMWDAWTASR